jgi:hypothetical protein
MTVYNNDYKKEVPIVQDTAFGTQRGRRDGALQGKAEVVISPDPSNETVGRLLRDADALILRTATKVTRAMIAASPGSRLFPARRRAQ